MQRKWMSALVVLGALACGEKKAETPADQMAQPAAPDAAAQPTGPVVEVNMTGAGTVFKYEPAAITLPVGGTARFINVTGGPHNVAFYPDSIPAGTADKLNAAMANRMDNLSGPFLINPNDRYDVSFAGLPAGVYKGFCTPHLALGMKFTLTVQ